MMSIKKMSILVLVYILALSVTADLNSCDTWVALPDATESGLTIFAKNSDRLLFDCQPLMFQPRKTWLAGSELNLGRIKIPQVRDTYATIGSSPYWCWGYEEGINEYGVVIGNEGVYTKVLAEEILAYRKGERAKYGPTGMDLVRLGLERGKTAREALDVITGLTEKYGQLGSGMPTLDDISGAYHNFYIIADSNEAWVLETVGKRWIAKKFTNGSTSISNKLSISNDWDLASPDIVEYALQKGWWQKDKADDFNFSEAYSDDTPANQARNLRAHTRAARSCQLLQEKEGEITPRWMMHIARDRSTSPSIDLDQTASACVAILPNTTDKLPVFWWCAITPSNSCYVPFFIHGSKLPEIISTAGTSGKRVIAPNQAEQDEFSPKSYWWLFRDLCDKVRSNYKDRNPLVRVEFDLLEKEFEAGIPEIMARAVELRAAGKVNEAAKILDDYTAECVARTLEKVNELRERFDDEVVEAPGKYKPYVGKYNATYKDEQLTVLVQNGHLAVDVPGQGVFELKEPDESGQWYFAITDQVAVSFERDDAGKVIAMKTHQKGLELELLRDGFEPPVEIELEKLQKYVGTYYAEHLNTNVKVLIQNNRLALDVPGQIR